MGFLHGFPLTLPPSRPLRNQLFSLLGKLQCLPLPVFSMTGIHDFVVDLAKGGKSFGDIKKLMDDVYGDKALKKTQIYEILKLVKLWKNTDD
jgi:hypothetical protein